MFFFSLTLFLLIAYFLAWWTLPVAAVLLGFRLPRMGALKVALAGGLSETALAFIQDGRSFGLISLRMSALFHLPGAWALFILMFLIGFIGVALGFLSGAYLSLISRRNLPSESKA